MIIGIGTDLANIERIGATIARFGERFKKRVFTDIEIAKAEGAHKPAAVYAKRWAAKEACSKALGTGLSMGISWKDMSVSNLKSGQPRMQLSGWAAKKLEELTPNGYVSEVNVSITDDYPWAHAYVVIDANKKDEQHGQKG